MNTLVILKISYLLDNFESIDRIKVVIDRNRDNHNYFIDLLLFNYEFNAFVVIELKLRSLRKEDKAQIEFYMKLVDEQVKKPFHNKTIGIIISKESDNFIVNFIRSEDIILLYYELLVEE